MRTSSVPGGEHSQRAPSSVDGLFAVHFRHGRDLGDPVALTETGAAAGMDRERLRAFLPSDAGMPELDSALAEARRLGVRSVPTFVFDGAFAVQGAQPPALLGKALERAALAGSS
jgi:predicted DsbA family dithiol-disulfide isomerase